VFFNIIADGKLAGEKRVVLGSNWFGSTATQQLDPIPPRHKYCRLFVQQAIIDKRR
jgi:hypothetical protein